MLPLAMTYSSWYSNFSTLTSLEHTKKLKTVNYKDSHECLPTRTIMNFVLILKELRLESIEAFVGLELKKKPPIFLLPRFSQVRNLYGFFLFWGDGRVPYIADNTAGFSYVAQEHFKLNALPNTTTDLFGIRTLNFLTSPTPLSARPRLLPLCRTWITFA